MAPGVLAGTASSLQTSVQKWLCSLLLKEHFPGCWDSGIRLEREIGVLPPVLSVCMCTHTLFLCVLSQVSSSFLWWAVCRGCRLHYFPCRHRHHLQQFWEQSYYQPHLLHCHCPHAFKPCFSLLTSVGIPGKRENTIPCGNSEFQKVVTYCQIVQFFFCGL